MSQDFIYPTASELRRIEQDKLPRLTQDRPIFKHFPIVPVNNHLLQWEQKDNYTGLQQLRGLGGAPQRVNRVGAKRYMAEPGVYGEFVPLDELELTRRRELGTWGQPVDLTDLVTEQQDMLLGRRVDRIELIAWNCARGTFSVSGPNGIVHTDSYTIQTYSAGVAWATVATAAPIKDFRAVKLLARGHSVSFGRQATAYMNQTTFNYAMNNTNANDIGGKRVAPSVNILELDQINKVLFDNDLPQIEIYDDTYLDDAGTPQLYIPNSKVVVFGARPGGQPLGEYRMTRNANNPNMGPGAYTKVIDTMDREVPRRVEVHDGHNGGPVIFFGSGVVEMSV